MNHVQLLHCDMKDLFTVICIYVYINRLHTPRAPAKQIVNTQRVTDIMKTFHLLWKLCACVRACVMTEGSCVFGELTNRYSQEL